MRRLGFLIILSAMLLIPSITRSDTCSGTFTRDSAAGGGGGYATPAHVQSNSGYSSGPATLGSNSTTGNTIAVWVSANSTLASLSLSGGGVTTWNYGTMYTDATSQTWGRWAYGAVTTGGAVSITITNGGTDPGWSIYEISGIDTSSALDQQTGTASQGWDTGTWSSGNVTTTLDNEALLGGWASEYQDPGVTWGSGWGNSTIQNAHYHGTALRIVSSTGSYAASGTNTNTGTDGVVVIITLKAKSL